MAVPIWQPGHLYQPGDLVRRATGGARVPIPIANADFEDGATKWTVGVFVVSSTDKFQGAKSLEFPAGPFGTHVFEHEDYVPCAPGTSVTASCMVQQGASSNGKVGGNVDIWFYDAAHNRIGGANGNNVNSGSGGSWQRSSVTTNAPAGTAFVRIAGHATRAGENKPLWIDSFAWNLTDSDPNNALIYRAVQPRSGFSGSSEPNWPNVLGVRVDDNEVIWEAIGTSRITWRANPILKSGGVEPVWSLVIGGEVVDGTVSWKATSQRVEDPKCPNSKILQIAASKIFAADGDIIKHSATVNPLDWSSERDAGYLAFGLQTYGAGNPAQALGLYRSNLVAFNAISFQMWQVDEDPSNNTLLDALPIGSTEHKALAPAANDLFFLSSKGVRTVGNSGNAQSLATADAGMPIDDLTKPAIAAARASGKRPISTYFPAAGQYWLAFPGYVEGGGNGTTVFVYTITRVGAVGAWSRYVFPFLVDRFATMGDFLYIRSGDDFLRVDEDAIDDFAGDPRQASFDCIVQWPWLDFGSPGVTKTFYGFDHVGVGSPFVSIGYDQSNKTRFTDPYQVPADTVPGEPIALPVSGPSFSVRLTYNSHERFKFQAFNVWLTT
ncbi:hypothetical protein [Lysobacter sp. CA199]|uniref:hypothetical protein n=1 Tax=Lysobacter sp. CA199 TaxID=3455608 RepID=UPI003F8CF7F1